MEYIDGPSLEDVLAERREEARRASSKRPSASGDPEYIAGVVEQFATLAEGLHEAHRQGLVHRDVKPSNILVDASGHYVLVDFGLVHEEEAQTITRSGELVGTLGYMSPEQVSRGHVDARSDVYSLGVNLYELLSLERPYRGESDHEMQRAILFKEPVPPRKHNPRIHRDVETIIVHALEKDPERRYSSALAFASDLRRFLRYEPIEASAPTPLSRVLRRAWFHRGKVAAGALILFLLLLSIVLGVVHVVQRERQLAAEYGPRVLEQVLKIEGAGLAALEGLSPIVGADTEDQAALEESEEIFSATGDEALAEAVRELEEIASTQPHRPDAYYHCARALWLLGRDDEALDDLETLLRHEDFIPARILRAEILRGQGREGPSVQSPGEGWAKHWYEAHTARRERRFPDAVAAYSELLKLPKSPYLGAQVEFRLGRGLARLEMRAYEDAREDFLIARDRWRGTLAPTLLLGESYVLMDRMERAQQTFQEFSDDINDERDPEKKDEFALAVASLLRGLKKFEEARSWIDRIRDPFFKARGSVPVLAKLGRWDEALASAEEACRLRNNDAWAHRYRAWVLQKFLRWDDAIRAYEEAIALDENNSLDHVALGILWGGRDRQAAESHLRAALKKAPRSAIVWNQWGAHHEHDEDLDRAIECYRRAIKIDASYYEAHQNYQSALRKRGRLQEAIEYYESHLAKNEHDAFFRALLGRAHRCGKNDSEALRHLTEAVKLDRRLALAWNFIGHIHRDRGNLEEAESAYRRAVEVDPSWNVSAGNLAKILRDQKRIGEAIEAFQISARAAPYHWSVGSLSQLVFLEDAVEGFRLLSRWLRGTPIRKANKWSFGFFLRGLLELEHAPEVRQDIVAVLRRLDDDWAHADEEAQSVALQALAVGWLLYPESSDFEKARKYARLYLQASFPPGETFRFASLFREAGDLAGAVELLEEALQQEPGSHSLKLLLFQCGAELPRETPSYALVDGLIESGSWVVLVPGESSWRYFPGTQEPSKEPLEWTVPDFRAPDWRLGPAPIGYATLPRRLNTRLDDMEGRYTSVYLRHVFAIPEDGGFEDFVLLVWADDAFVAYLDGEKVGGERTGSAEIFLPHDWAVTEGSTGLAPDSVLIPAEKLKPGRHCLATHAFNQIFEFKFRALLAGRRSANVEEIRTLLDEAFPKPDDEERRSRFLLFAEACFQEKEGSTDEALATLDRVIERDPDAPYLYYRRAATQRRVGKSAEAERSLREALRLLPGSDRLAERACVQWWEIVARDLGYDLAKASSLLDDLLARRQGKTSGLAYDLRWVLEELSSNRAIRINCGGGDEYTGKGNIHWSQDRFYQGGRLFAGGKETFFAGEIDKTDDDVLYKTERWFPRIGSSRYRVPLPRGEYRVSLHFAEIWRPESRKFGVNLEGNTKLPEYVPPFTTADVESFNVPVEDGFLDVEFVRQVQNPKISALEIERLPD